MTREMTITETVRELRSQLGIEANRKTVQRRCVAGKIKCRKTEEGIYLIPESQLQPLAESLRQKGS